MKSKQLGFIVLSCWLFAAHATDTNSLPFISPMFGDNMVLQRGRPNSIWGWSKPGDVIQVEIAGHAAKTIADVGSMPDGRIEPRQIEVLNQVGAWLAKNGESIYGTRGGPWKPTAGNASTRKGKTIYVHILKWPEGAVKLPNISAKIVGAKILGGGKAEFHQTESGIEISVSPAFRDANDTVVVLKLDSDALKNSAVTVPTEGVQPKLQAE